MLSICVVKAVDTTRISVQERPPIPSDFSSQTWTHTHTLAHIENGRERESDCSRSNDHGRDCYLFFTVTKTFLEMAFPPKGHQGWDHLFLLLTTIMAAEVYPDMWMERVWERAHLFFLLMGLFISLAYPHLLDWILRKVHRLCYWHRENVTGWEVIW